MLPALRLVLRSAALLALASGAAPVWADTPSDEEEDPRIEEVVIYGERLWQARAALESHLASLGYRPVRRFRGRTLYMPPGEKRWKPKVVVDDDGWMTFRSPNIVFQGLEARSVPGITTPAQELPGFQPPTGASFGARFWIISERKLKAQEAMLTEELWIPLAEIRAMIAHQAHLERMIALPDELDALWAAARDPAARRQRLLDRWLACADTPEGAEARQIIETFLEQVVQTSEAPFTEAELQAARAACGCALLGAGPSSSP